ncbi:SH3 domain-containing protein [Streptomyces sp. NPDC003077]|uniref:SH3 domain-containing protein n=1 Tax=Streptomyces sp. NPDC003077 TaxID=3154443 RepID=UPI0033A6734C
MPQGAVAAEAVALAATSYPIVPGYRVNVRQGPSTKHGVVRQLPYNARVTVRCQRSGERVSGPLGTSDVWDNIGPGQYISDTYVKTGSNGPVAPRCTS